MRGLIGLAAVLAIIVIPLLFAYLAYARNTKYRKAIKENKTMRHALMTIEEDAAGVAAVANIETQLNYAADVATQIRNLRRKELS